MKRFSTLVPVMAVLALCALACGSEEDNTHGRAACAPVNTENWHLSTWGNEPTWVCETNVHVRGGLWPCTLGGAPMLCEIEGDDTVVYTLHGHRALNLAPEDLHKIGGALQFIR